MISMPLMAGGGWVSDPGTGYIKFRQRMIYGDQFFNRAGMVIPIRTTGVYTTGIYGEAGIAENWEVIIDMPVYFRMTLNEVRFESSGRMEPGDAYNGIGDLTVGVKRQLFARQWVGAVSLFAGMPTGNPTGGRTGLLSSGDGEFNQMVRIDVGRSLYPLPMYINFYGAFNHRTKGFSEEVYLGGEAGYTGKRVGAILRIDRLWSL